MKRFIRAVILLLFGLGVCAQEIVAPAEEKSHEVHLRATLEAVVPLTEFVGEVTPIDVDPKFALRLRVKTVEPVIEEFVSGAVLTLAIHSPWQLFAEEPTKSATYNFHLQRKTEGGKMRFFDLRVVKNLGPHRGYRQG